MVCSGECGPLLPVTTGIRRGLLRTLKMMGLCTQGIRKCVPSPTTLGRTPLNLSNITALSPPSTGRGGIGKQSEDSIREEKMKGEPNTATNARETGNDFVMTTDTPNISGTNRVDSLQYQPL